MVGGLTEVANDSRGGCTKTTVLFHHGHACLQADHRSRGISLALQRRQAENFPAGTGRRRDDVSACLECCHWLRVCE